MILIRALETATKLPDDAGKDELRKRINYAFANRLRHYILKKNMDSCMLFKYSPNQGTRSMAYYVTYYEPTVVIYIDCAYDIDPTIHGYHVLCDAYTSLVKTIVYEMHMQEQEFIINTVDEEGVAKTVKEVKKLLPDKDPGYSVDRTLTYGSVSDIQINLGYLSSDYDSQYLNEDCLTTELGDYDDEYEAKEHLVKDCLLDIVAKRIVDGSYGPPIVDYENNDITGSNDPYFYLTDVWNKPLNYDGTSTHELVRETYNSIPVNSVKITGNEATDVTVDIDGNIINNTGRYWLSTYNNYDQQCTCHFICSYKTSGTNVTAYVSVGNYVYTKLVNSLEYEVLNFRVEVKPYDEIRIGIEGSGTIWYSAIWLSPVEVIGTFDDPRSKYSMYPPGYRTRVLNEVPTYTGDDPITVAITSADSLVGRARDKIVSTDTKIQDNIEEAVTVATNFVSSIGETFGQLQNSDPEDAKIISSTASVASKARNSFKELISKASNVNSLFGKLPLLVALATTASTAEAAGSGSWSAPSSWEQAWKDDASILWENYAKAKQDLMLAKEAKRDQDRDQKNKEENAKDNLTKAKKALTESLKAKKAAASEVNEANKNISKAKNDLLEAKTPEQIAAANDKINSEKERLASAKSKLQEATDAQKSLDEAKASAAKELDKVKTQDSSPSTGAGTNETKITSKDIEALETAMNRAKKAFNQAVEQYEKQAKEKAKEAKDVAKNYKEKLKAVDDAKQELSKAETSRDQLKASLSQYNSIINDANSSVADKNKATNRIADVEKYIKDIDDKLPGLKQAITDANNAATEYYNNNKAILG